MNEKMMFQMNYMSNVPKEFENLEWTGFKTGHKKVSRTFTAYRNNQIVLGECFMIFEGAEATIGFSYKELGKVRSINELIEDAIDDSGIKYSEVNFESNILPELVRTCLAQNRYKLGERFKVTLTRWKDKRSKSAQFNIIQTFHDEETMKLVMVYNFTKRKCFTST
jgi:hypothetical protein